MARMWRIGGTGGGDDVGVPTWVRVAGTHTDTYNVRKLRRALPDCEVQFESLQ